MITIERTKDYELRQAEIEDLPKMENCAREFYASSRFLKGFDIAKFCQLWSQLLARGTGVIFMLESDGEIQGSIGGVIYPDAYSESLIATEFFWFVRHSERGQGLKLYRAFETWAREKACDEIRMVHLHDSMPERLATLYRRLGYQAAETHYVKELAP
jgi:GNAT superfamily N-acetyltransferase